MANNKKDISSHIKVFIANNGQQVCLVLAMLILGTILSFASPYFLTAKNLSNILLAICVPGVIVSGLTVSMLIGNLDLSQYANLGFNGMLLGVMLTNGWSFWVAMPLVLCSGLAIGFINATLVTKVGIAPMIATIGTQLMLNAGMCLLTNGRSLTLDNAVLKYIGFSKILGISVEIYILAIVVIVVWYVLKYTAFGRKVFACGGNAKASELAGISVTRIKYAGYMISGFAASLAAILYCAQASASSTTAGTANSMDGITGVFLGGVAWGGGKGSVLGSILGVFFLQIFSNGMTLLSVPSYWQSFIKGFVLLLSISIDVVRTKNANKVRKIKHPVN